MSGLSPHGVYILVIEDNDDVREGLERIMRSEGGYEVVACANGRAALDFLRVNPAPRIILLDFSMPQVDGWQFLEERSKNETLARVPVIGVTANARMTRATARSMNVVGICRKPFEVEILLAMVKTCIDRNERPTISGELLGEPAEVDGG